MARDGDEKKGSFDFAGTLKDWLLQKRGRCVPAADSFLNRQNPGDVDRAHNSLNFVKHLYAKRATIIWESRTTEGFLRL